MKRFGHLIEKIITPENMLRAFKSVVDKLPTSKPIHYRSGKIVYPRGYKHPLKEHYYNKKDEIISNLVNRISKGTFLVTEYKEMTVRDGPKIRVVQSPKVEDRIGCNAIMHIVEEVLYPSIIHTSGASIPGKGMHLLFNKIKRDIRKNPGRARYYYKCDIKKFFESIDHDKMIGVIRKKIKDPILLPMLENFVKLMPKGLSIGLRSSQCYGNIFLSDLDHYIKDVLGVKMYYRYCDDLVIFGETKKELWELRDKIHEQVNTLGLSIKPNEQICPLKAGLDFLGYVYNGHTAKLRKRTKVIAARKLSRVKSKKRRQAIIGSFKGMAKWGDCKKLYKTLTNKTFTLNDLNDILRANGQSLDDIEINGKRMLKGETESIINLVNTRIKILDFETDIETKNGKRCVIQFNKVGDETEKVYKYMTSDNQQISILIKAKENNMLPLEVGVKVDTTWRINDKPITKYTFTN